MIRIIVEEVDDSAVAAGAADRPMKKYRTFDIDAPVLEEHLRNPKGYVTRQVIGIELPATAAPQGE